MTVHQVDLDLVVPCPMCDEIHREIFCAPVDSRPESRIDADAYASAHADADASATADDATRPRPAPPGTTSTTEPATPTPAEECSCCHGTGRHEIEYLEGASTTGVRIVECGCQSGSDGCEVD